MTKMLTFLSILTALLGARAISIDFKVFQLSLFRILIIIIMIILMLKNTSINLSRKKKNNYSVKFMILWLFYAIISVGWVKHYGDWFRAVYFIALGVICVIIYTNMLKKDADILTAFRMMSIMIIVHNIIGWLEIITDKYLFLSGDIVEIYAHYNYPVSTFLNLNDFALCMLFSIFICYICFVNAKHKIIKVAYIILMISSALLLVFTDSRGNLIGLILAISYYIFLKIKDNKWKYPLLLFLSIIGLFILLFSNLPDYLYDAARNLMYEFEVSKSSDTIRLNLIKNGFIFFGDTFGFGTGAGNIEYWMANYSVYDTGNIVNIHNWWMEILVGYGFLIFALYIIFYVKLYKTLYKKYKYSSDKLNNSISLGILCCMIGYIIASISSSSNIQAEWLWVFWSISIAYQGIDEGGNITI